VPRIEAGAAARARIQMEGMTTASAPGANGGSVPKEMPPPVQVVSPDRAMTKKEQVGVAAAQRWIVQAQSPHLDHDGVLHFTDGHGQVQIVASVNHVTDIRLEPGENILLPISVGDAEDWVIHIALGRQDGQPVAHITVKPDDAGLSSNLVIHTSKRTLSVELASRQKEFMPLVALDAAETSDDQPFSLLTAAQGNMVQTPCDLPPTVPKEQFSVRGDAVPWRPIDVYWVTTPVGTKTCVTFPDGINSGDLPALLELADDGGWFSDATKRIVDVRFVNRRFIVDEALNRFILVSGVGGDQEAITVTRRPPK
jgi:type IV secretion system protein VirB9